MPQRDPSIHIRRSSLSEILEGIIDVKNIEPIVDEIFRQARPHAIQNRILTKPNVQTKKKAARTVSVDKTLAQEFHGIYQQENMANQIKTAAITPSDSKYLTLKEVAKQADEFCQMFNLSRDQGFRVYVRIAITLAGRNYSIYRVKGLADKIIQRYKDLLKIQEDEDSDGTKEFYAQWRMVSIKYIGGATDITEPGLYAHFIYGREAADQAEADYYDWIAAQFERWSSINGSTPELSQLYGDNAKLAYTKYMGLQNKEYDTKEEKSYFEGKAKVRLKTPQRKRRTGRS